MKTKANIVPQVERELETLALSLKVSRLRRKISQDELAKRCGVSRETIVRLETEPGKVSLEIFLTAVYMLDRLDEISGFLEPIRDQSAMAGELAEVLGRKRKVGPRHDAKRPSFDWESLEGMEMISPLTGEKYKSGERR